MAVTEKGLQAIRELGLQEQQVFAQLDKGLLLSIADVAPNTFNPKACNDERLLAIASSIELNGWMPSELPLVWETPDGPTKYTLINGEHRWLICKTAGFDQFPAVIANAIKSESEALALTMALEDARARRDAKAFTNNLIRLAAENRDELLRRVLRQRDPEELRRLVQGRKQAASDTVAKARKSRESAPRLYSLMFTRKQHEQFQEALGKARTRLRIAQETIGMLEELSEADIVAIAAVLRNAR